MILYNPMRTARRLRSAVPPARVTVLTLRSRRHISRGAGDSSCRSITIAQQMTVNPDFDRRTRTRYSQELAAYTLRQFSTARAQLDEGKKEDIAKLPAAYQRVVSAEKLSSHADGARPVKT